MKPAKKIAIYLFVLLIFSLLVGRDFSLLFQVQAPAGIDGYYYVLQIETLRSRGHLYFPSNTPLTIYFLTALSFSTRNVVVAVKIGAVFLHVFLVIGMFALTTILTRNVWLGILSLLITAASGLHLYMIGEFLSSLGASTFLVWGAFGIVKAQQNKTRLWLAFSIIFFICAVFAHRSALGLIVLFSFTIVSANLLLNKNLKSSRRFSIFSAALFLLPLAAARQTFFRAAAAGGFRAVENSELAFSINEFSGKFNAGDCFGFDVGAKTAERKSVSMRLLADSPE